MNAALVVEAPGLATTLQDFGRIGHQALGVPVSGALDPDALCLANTLVGNGPGEAALEIRVAGPTLRVAAEAVRVALCGTSASIEVLEPEPRRVPAGESLHLGRDALFRVASLRDSATGYLAVAGGFDVAPVLGSRSTYLRGGFGGFAGRALAKGDRLPLRQESAPDTPELRSARPPDLIPPERIRVVLGPQADHFTEGGIETLLTQPFRVTRAADRMGLRLDGPPLEHARGYNIVSDGIATGAIQVPGDGMPIVLLADHQTTGGYPKVATVVAADLPALGRVSPGAQLRFASVTLVEAQALRRAHGQRIAEMMRSVEPARLDPAQLSSGALLSKNLIGGVLKAGDDHEVR